MNGKLLAGFAGGALALALAIGAVASSGSSSAQTSAAQATAAPAQTTPTPAQPAGPGTNRPGPGHGKVEPPEGGLIQATADLTGLQPREVVQELRSSKSLAQIAQEHGKTADDVVAAARTKLQERLKQAVADGKLTQERADQRLANFDQTAPQVMNDTNLGRPPRPRGGPRQPFGGGLIQATADVTGLQPQEIMQELRSGKSLAQIAQAHGKTGDDILAKLREQGQQRLNESLDRAKQLIEQPGLQPGQQDGTAPAAPPTQQS